MDKRIVCVCLLLLVLSCHSRRNIPLHKMVNPFIGTAAHGHTYPGAVAPFGMLQLSPDSRLDGWDGCSAYHYSDSVIYGFSHTHLSGTGISDYGDVLLMPMLGDGVFNNGAIKGIKQGYASYFSHQDELAEAGYYKVQLKDDPIQVELTAGQRTAMHRYTFPKSTKKATVVIDLLHRDKLLDVALEQNGSNELVGFRRSTAWATDQYFYFVLRSNHPIASITYQKDRINGVLKKTKALVRFKNPKELVFSIGGSAVDIDGAIKNLEAEPLAKNFNFDGLKTQTQRQWDEQLAKIKIKGGSLDQQKIFYTALYHNFIVPNLFSDTDGKYRGLDGAIHKTDHKVYTIFSLWDTYRATHPLYNLIARDKSKDFIKTMLLHYKNSGRLPVWELAGNETNCMIGYHAVSVIADAYNKGVNEFDTDLALKAMKASALDQNDAGINAILHKGFIEMSDNPESVSKTLEYAYDNWCIAQFAKAKGIDSTYKKFLELSQLYKQIFDPSSKLMRARINGGWFQPFSPAEVNYNYTEANAWQYSLYVPQDINGWIKLAGGSSALLNYLDTLFASTEKLKGHTQADITGLIGQYAHGNEPSHHIAYLYNYVGQASKTQQRVREILSTLYKNTPAGLSGNEDCGQMSAWFVFSAMGFYPVTPASDIYAIGSPLFDEIELTIGTKSLKIIAQNNSASNIYIQSATLNGVPLNNSYLSYQQIKNGGLLILKMGAQPSSWASSKEHCPKSQIPSEYDICITPHFKAKTTTFTDSLLIEIEQSSPRDSIYFWIGKEADTSHAERYEKPFFLKKEAQIFAYAINSSGLKSKIVKAHYKKLDPDRSIQLKTKFTNRYASSGEQALIDGWTGGKDYRSGFWQGFEGEDLEFIVDLGAKKTITSIALSCLQDQRSWIWTPKKVLFESSIDGITFQKIGLAQTQVPRNLDTPKQELLGLQIRREARYIRVKAFNAGACPSWHAGAGGKSWIFADEFFIETN